MTVKEIRKLTGLTQKQFAEKYHITFSTIRNWESGHRNCPDYVVELLEFKVKEDLRMDTQEILKEILERIDREVFDSLSDSGDDWFTAGKVSQIKEIISEYMYGERGKENE